MSLKDFKLFFDKTNQPAYLYQYAKMVWQACEEIMAKKKKAKKPTKK